MRKTIIAMQKPYHKAKYQKRILLILNIYLTLKSIAFIETIINSKPIYPYAVMFHQHINIYYLMLTLLIIWFAIIRPIPILKKLQWFILTIPFTAIPTKKTIPHPRPKTQPEKDIVDQTKTINHEEWYSR